jgi:hypothetical protein
VVEAASIADTPNAAASARANRPTHMPAAVIAVLLGPAAIEARKMSRESGPGEMVIRAPVRVKLKKRDPGSHVCPKPSQNELVEMTLKA